MRRTKLVLAVAAVMVASLAMVPGPAVADDFEFEDGFFFVSGGDFGFDDGFFFVGDDDFDFFDGYDDFSFGGDGVNQSFEQESEGGDVDQSFDVS